MAIPSYPAFRPITLEDKAVFDAAFRAHPPGNSEYTFTNLYSWRSAHDFIISKRDDLIILASLLAGRSEYYPPIGGGDSAKTIKTILLETRSKFIRIPEEVKVLFDKDPSIHAVEDRANADYLFLAQDLIRLEGRKYDGKRNFIKNFKSKYEYEYIPVTEDIVQEVLSFQDVWCVERGCSQSKSLLDESEAVKIMLTHLKQFHCKAGAIRVHGKICAVCIAERLNPRTLVIHVLKGARGMTGIYQTIFNEFLSREAAGYQFVNMEQDLGIEGLRKSKESYHPVSLARKFTLSLADEKGKI
jgi:uncharacterized protein